MKTVLGMGIVIDAVAKEFNLSVAVFYTKLVILKLAVLYHLKRIYAERLLLSWVLIIGSYLCLLIELHYVTC